MSKQSESILSFGIGTLIGVIAGVAAAVILAPKSGEETRENLKTAVKNIVKENAPNFSYTRKINSNALARLQYTIENQFNKVIEAIKAGKMAAAKRKEELESSYKY